MGKSIREASPRERLARTWSLMKRTRIFARSALAIVVVGLAASFALAWVSKRAWRSETTVLYHVAIEATDKDGDNSAARAAKLGPKLKDLLYARPRLEELITQYGLYPEKVQRSMVDAVEEMQTNIGYKPRSTDAFVISFVSDDPEVAQKITERLAENVISDYNTQNLSSATMTRDFLARELEEANKRVDDAGRGLAQFLAEHPQFQWGINDSPYAASPQGSPPGTPISIAPRQPLAKTPVPSDPQLAFLEKELQRVDGELAPPAKPGVEAPAATTIEAQKQRDDAAKALAQAQTNLAEKLATVTPQHPDAIAAQQKVEAAKTNLAAAEANLRAVRAGNAPPIEANPALSAERKAELEKDRASLQRQIADRRRVIASGNTDAPPAATDTPKAEQPKALKAPASVVDLETEWHRLKLDLDRARDELHTVQANAHQADVAADAMEKRSQAEMQILEPAYRPTRPDRGKGRVFLIGALITLFAALGYAATRVLLNDTLLDADDIEALGGPQVLVALPRFTAARVMPLLPEHSVVPVERASDLPPPPAPPPPPVVQQEPPPAPQPQPQPHARKIRATMRFGSPMPVEQPRDEVEVEATVVAAPAPPPSSALTLIRSPNAPLATVVVDAPEVEVIGKGEGAAGVQALLRGASSQALAALRVLRHRLDQKRAHGSYVVSVMSPSAGEGKTTLAARLALTLAEADRARVVLVEGNLDRPRLAAALSLKLTESSGFSAQIRARMLGHHRPWGVVRLGRTMALLAEPWAESAYPEAVHSAQFEEALAALRRNFDYVVIDGPSVLGAGDANVIEDVSDGVVLVARASATKGAELAKAAQQLGERRILGVVLNDVLQPPPERASNRGRRAA